MSDIPVPTSFSEVGYPTRARTARRHVSPDGKWKLPVKEQGLGLLGALWDMDERDALPQETALNLLDLLAAASFLASPEFQERLADAKATEYE